jgi:hypothetical protein
LLALDPPEGDLADHLPEAHPGQRPVVPDCREALLEAHRSGVAFDDLAGGLEREQVDRDADDGEDQRGDSQRALEVLGAGDLGETTRDSKMIAPAAPSVRALASLARSWGSWVIAEARNPKGMLTRL